jgi:hypothetical protein
VTRFSAYPADAFLLGAGELASALPKDDPLKNMPPEPSALQRHLRRTAWFQRTKVSGEGPCAQDLHDCSASTRRNIRAMFGTDILTLLRYPYTRRRCATRSSRSSPAWRRRACSARSATPRGGGPWASRSPGHWATVWISSPSIRLAPRSSP